RRYLINTSNRDARPQSMRGCTCHFILDLDDQVSITLWVENNKKSTFIYQDASDTDSFILGIQTEWQLQQMIRFGHHSLMAADSTFGIKKLKGIFCCPVIFSLWRVHRSWVRNIVKRCDNIEVQQEMFKCLGRIAYSILGRCGFCRCHGGIHSRFCYWFDGYVDEIDFFRTVKEDYIASSSWHRALKIPENAIIIFDDEDRLFAKVISQNDPSHTHIVWNPGSDLSLCDCSWSLQGNLCKHDHRPSMSFQSFRSIILSLCQKHMDDSVALDQSLAWYNQMLDQIQRSVELDNSNGVSNIVKNLPLKWTAKKVEHLLAIHLS
ncbi:hypothetical protein MKW92_015470, partial [Papaver armeniacum]